MSIKFHCYYCDVRLEAENEHSGLEVECPNCHQKITIPLISVNTEEIPRLRESLFAESNELDELLKFPEEEHETSAKPLIDVDTIKKMAETHFHKTESGKDHGYDVGPTRFRAGQRVGNFEIGYFLGEGSMGQVFLARQITMDREVALKILPPEILSQDREAGRQFLNEVKTLAKLEHPNIVTAFEAGEENGIYYLAMQYVNGETLEKRLEREKFLPEKEALKIMLKVAEALKYAWDHYRLLHQDIKPANIMIDRKGEVKLTDMGIAKISTDEKGVATFVMGTPFYMSPEQAQGKLNLDWRSDQYSMGATLYHLLTGRYPFLGENAAEVMRKHVTDPLVPPRQLNPKISKETDRLIRKMMAKNPDKRFQSWDELIRAIQTILQLFQQAEKPTTSKTSTSTQTSRRRIHIKRAGLLREQRGPSRGITLLLFLGMFFLCYLLLSFINRSGILHRANIYLPQDIFLPVFRVYLPDGREY